MQYAKKLDIWRSFRNEALEIKRYKYKDEPDEFLDQLVERNLVEAQESPTFTNLKIPQQVTLKDIEKIV